MKSSVLIVLAGAVSTSLMIPLLSHGGDRAGKSPTEAGRVDWHRDYDAGRSLVTATKPMMLLFQEIPG